MEATVFLFEVPTGVVADTYSRRLSLIIGFLGYRARPGCSSAWSSSAWLIVRALGVLGACVHVHERRLRRRGSRTRSGSTGGAGLPARRPLLVRRRDRRPRRSGARDASTRAAVIAGGAVDDRSRPRLHLLDAGDRFPAATRGRAERLALTELRTTAGTAARYVRAAPLLLLIIGIAVFEGASSEAFDRLKEAHLIRNVGFPVDRALRPGRLAGSVERRCDAVRVLRRGRPAEGLRARGYARGSQSFCSRSRPCSRARSSCSRSRAARCSPSGLSSLF